MMVARIDRFRAYYIAKVWNTNWKPTPAVYEALDKWRDEGHDWIVKTERERYGKLQGR